MLSLYSRYVVRSECLFSKARLIYTPLKAMLHINTFVNMLLFDSYDKYYAPAPPPPPNHQNQKQKENNFHSSLHHRFHFFLSFQLFFSEENKLTGYYFVSLGFCISTLMLLTLLFLFPCFEENWYVILFIFKVF